MTSKDFSFCPFLAFWDLTQFQMSLLQEMWWDDEWLGSEGPLGKLRPANESGPPLLIPRIIWTSAYIYGMSS